MNDLYVSVRLQQDSTTEQLFLSCCVLFILLSLFILKNLFFLSCFATCGIKNVFVSFDVFIIMSREVTACLTCWCWCSQCSSSTGTEERKGGSSLQEAKRRGKMERGRDEDEEELNDKLQTLVRLRRYSIMLIKPSPRQPGTVCIHITFVCMDVCLCAGSVQPISSQRHRSGLLWDLHSS